jgi:hypothetical protein
MNAGLGDEESANSVAACHLSAWLQMDFCTMWCYHFIKFVKPPPQKTVLLFLEIHYTKKEYRSYLEEKAIVCVL